MDLLQRVFKFVSVTFAVAAVTTGIQAIVDPIGFSRSFGLPVAAQAKANASKTTNASQLQHANDGVAMPYVSLMGVRQLATGITLLTFAYQAKWREMATILTILGFVVASTDAFYLARSGAYSKARFHAIPGTLIATLAAAVVFTDP